MISSSTQGLISDANKTLNVSPTNNPLSRNRFQKVFTDEFSAFKSDAHSLTTGRVSYANKLSDIFRLGLISSGSAAIITTFGLLAAFGVISSFVTLGVGLAVSIASIAAGIGYNVFLYRRAKRRYTNVDKMLDVDNFQELTDQVVDKLIELYADRMKFFNKEEMTAFARHCEDAVSNALVMGKVSKLEDLLDANKLKSIMIEASKKDPMLEVTPPRKKTSFNTSEIITMTKAHEDKYLSPASKHHSLSRSKPATDKNENISSFSRFVNWIRNSLFGPKKPVVLNDTTLAEQYASSRKI